ncbi:MAG: hypothetical protein M3P18_20835 [Actinomycetota bacterium]|nr:hypothetical protein [Actinomycetota bacterium]
MQHVLVTDLTPVSPHVRPNSFALLSGSDETDTAAVFVHGFGGHPDKTWSRMQEMLHDDPAWERTDAYFLGYWSTKHELSKSAAYIGHFIQELCKSQPHQLLSATAPGGTDAILRTGTARYKSLDLVGHSAGGAVLRLLLLEMSRRREAGIAQPDLLFEAHLRLFAPAISGARFSHLKGRLTRTLGLRELIDIYTGGSPSFQELQHGSVLLDAMREDTTFFAQSYPHSTAFRATIAWAEMDDVVTSLPFRHDVGWMLRTTTHQSVCKASPSFPVPFTFVKSGTLEGVEDAL